jgi:hypothetical protein
MKKGMKNYSLGLFLGLVLVTVFIFNPYRDYSWGISLPLVVFISTWLMMFSRDFGIFINRFTGWTSSALGLSMIFNLQGRMDVRYIGVFLFISLFLTNLFFSWKKRKIKMRESY